MSAPVDVLAAMERLMPGPNSSESELLAVRVEVRELLRENNHLRNRRNEIDNEAYEYSEKLEGLLRAVAHARPLLTKLLSDNEEQLRGADIYDSSCRIVDRLDEQVNRASGRGSHVEDGCLDCLRKERAALRAVSGEGR